MNSKVKMEEWFGHPDVNFSMEKRIPEAKEDARLRRFKEKCVLLSGISLSFLFFIVCVIFLFQHPENPVAMSSAFAIVSAVVGYAVRGKQ